MSEVERLLAQLEHVGDGQAGEFGSCATSRHLASAWQEAEALQGFGGSASTWAVCDTCYWIVAAQHCAAPARESPGAEEDHTRKSELQHPSINGLEELWPCPPGLEGHGPGRSAGDCAAVQRAPSRFYRVPVGLRPELQPVLEPGKS